MSREVTLIEPRLAWYRLFSTPTGTASQDTAVPVTNPAEDAVFSNANGLQLPRHAGAIASIHLILNADDPPTVSVDLFGYRHDSGSTDGERWLYLETINNAGSTVVVNTATYSTGANNINFLQSGLNIGVRYSRYLIRPTVLTGTNPVLDVDCGLIMAI